MRSAYAFSGKETETMLLNKLTAHYQTKSEAMAKAAQIAAEDTSAVAGKTYDELITRLNLIKP